MPALVWDKVGDRRYESGLDKAALYLPNGSAVPWNGLTSVTEKSGKEVSSVYYDGKKISDFVSIGEFEATMKAVTYPDEFVEIEGMGSLRNGAFLGDQTPQMFALCYRTRISNDLDPDEGYKIHIVYNITAIPNDKPYASTSEELSLVEFEWDLYAIPDETPGFRPTAHIVIDSREFDPWLMEQLEEILYGGTFLDATLLPMPELVAWIRDWCRYRITDNEDGTYTVTYAYPGGVTFSGTEDEIFHLIGIYVIHNEEDGTFEVADTCDISDVPQIKIEDNGDGTWTATTDFDVLIAHGIDGTANIFNANATMIAVDKYRISDTTEEA